MLGEWVVGWLGVFVGGIWVVFELELVAGQKIISRK